MFEPHVRTIRGERYQYVLYVQYVWEPFAYTWSRRQIDGPHWMGEGLWPTLGAVPIFEEDWQTTPPPYLASVARVLGEDWYWHPISSSSNFETPDA